MYFRIRYFSDMQSNSYPTWIFNLLEYFGKKINPLTKRLRSPVPYKTIHFKFIWANNTTKKILTLCNKTHSMGTSKQVRHEYLIRKYFLRRVNHDGNKKKAF